MKILSTLALFTFITTQSMAQQKDVLTRNRWIEKQIGIEDINKSSSDIDLRIFTNRGFSNGASVLQIVRRNNKWQGTRFFYVLKMKDGNVTEKVQKVKKMKLQSSNWDSLWIRLEHLNILSLPSQNEIKHKLRKEIDTPRGKETQVHLISDGVSYDLAVKKRNHIIGYSFHEPAAYAEWYPDVEEVRNYRDIIETLAKEFSGKSR